MTTLSASSQETREEIYMQATCPIKYYCNLLKMRSEMAENTERTMSERRRISNLIYRQCLSENERDECPIINGEASFEKGEQ